MKPKHPMEVIEEWVNLPVSVLNNDMDFLRALIVSVRHYFSKENMPTEEEILEQSCEYPIDDLGDSTSKAAEWAIRWTIERMKR